MDKYSLIINRLSLKYGIPKEHIKKMCESEFEFTREKLQSLDISKIQKEEDLEEYKATFSFMGLGKLYLNFGKLKKLRKKDEDNSNSSKSE